MLLSFGIKVIMGVIFSLSLYSKLVDPSDILEEIQTLKIVPSSLLKLGYYILLFVEVLIIFCFIFDFLYFSREIFTIVILLFFSATILLKRKRTNITSCSCFGENNILNKFPLLRNSILISFCITNLIMNRELSSALIIVGINIVIIFILAVHLKKSIKTLKIMRKINDQIK